MNVSVPGRSAGVWAVKGLCTPQGRVLPARANSASGRIGYVNAESSNESGGASERGPQRDRPNRRTDGERSAARGDGERRGSPSRDRTSDTRSSGTGAPRDRGAGGDRPGGASCRTGSGRGTTDRCISG